MLIVFEFYSPVNIWICVVLTINLESHQW
uniref:Uncharacterized protein n=1 Tax=Anguilla anguilla TaxID=7936 RepID=A0A0E9U4L0_ANGAN